MKSAASPLLVVGIAGGTASGKSRLAAQLAGELGAERCVILSYDCYYRGHPTLTAAARRKIDFDCPAAFETSLLLKQVRSLRRGNEVAMPHYDFARYRRARKTTLVPPASVVVIEGLFVLADAKLRRVLDLKIFVHTPADLRLIRRIQRDTTERGYSVAEVISRYASAARPGHERYVEPSRRHADLIWNQESDLRFPARLRKRIERSLAQR